MTAELTLRFILWSRLGKDFFLKSTVDTDKTGKHAG
jgi:hypothetical protein